MGDAVYTGRIVKGIAGFYYVFSDSFGVVECHAKGILRRGKFRPLVGDVVNFEMVDDTDDIQRGSIISINERHSSLIRPEVANVDQAVIIFAYESPEPNIMLLDRFLVMLMQQDVECVICFNKLDLVNDEKKESILQIYKECGFPVIDVSAKNRQDIDKLESILKGKVTALAGPSGVGKSTIINILCPDALMETGNVSAKTERGRHTTRHSELFHIADDTYIMDTPGFTAIELLEGLEADELKMYYREFYPYEGCCKYDSCSHTHEPSCAVKEALGDGKIHRSRYENYCSLYNELKNRKKY